MSDGTLPITGDRLSTYALVMDERVRQHEKWKDSEDGDCSSPNMDNLFRLGVLMEEVGEVAKALIERDDLAHVEEELVQVAAVCVAWIEGLQHDR